MQFSCFRISWWSLSFFSRSSSTRGGSFDKIHVFKNQLPKVSCQPISPCLFKTHISSYLVSQVPFEIYFPDYTDINNTTKYMQVNPARLSIPTVSRVIHLSSPVHDTH